MFAAITDRTVRYVSLTSTISCVRSDTNAQLTYQNPQILLTCNELAYANFDQRLDTEDM